MKTNTKTRSPQINLKAQPHRKPRIHQHRTMDIKPQDMDRVTRSRELKEPNAAKRPLPNLAEMFEDIPIKPPTLLPDKDRIIAGGISGGGGFPGGRPPISCHPGVKPPIAGGIAGGVRPMPGGIGRPTPGGIIGKPRPGGISGGSSGGPGPFKHPLLEGVSPIAR